MLYRFLRLGLLAAPALLLRPTTSRAQTPGSVGIGTTVPDPAAALDIRSTDKGLLIPRLDSTQRAGISSPPDGLMVFQTDGRKGFWYAIGGSWVYIPDKTKSGDNLGNHTATQNLRLNGNWLSNDGGNEGLRVDDAGKVGVGQAAPISRLANTAGNIGGSDGIGVNTSSLTWTNNTQGYVAAFYNSDASTSLGRNGLAVKVASNAANTAALDVSQSPTQTGAGTALLRVRADGTVGLGTSAPNARLDLSQGALMLASTLNNSATRPAVGTGRLPGEISAYGLTGGSTPSASADDGFLRLSAGGGTNAATKSFIDLTGYSTVADMNRAIVLGTGGLERLRLTSTGRLGLGLTDPQAALHVLGNQRIESDADALQIGATGVGKSAYLTFFPNGFANNRGGFLGYTDNGGTTLRLTNEQNGPLLLGTNGLPRLTVLGSGNVGIGTTSPDWPLTVQGTGTNSDLVSWKTAAGTTKWHFNLAGNGLNMAETGVSDNRLFLKPGGYVGINNGNPQVALDVTGVARATSFDMDLSIQTFDFTMGNNTFYALQMSCPNGTRLLGGGGGFRNVSNTNFSSALLIVFSGVEDVVNAPNTWTVRLANTSGTSRDARVHCQCARVQ